MYFSLLQRMHCLPNMCVSTQLALPVELRSSGELPRLPKIKTCTNIGQQLLEFQKKCQGGEVKNGGPIFTAPCSVSLGTFSSTLPGGGALSHSPHLSLLSFKFQ